MDITADITKSGYLVVGGSIYPGAQLLKVGDVDSNEQAIAFLSFDISDISSLDDVTIEDVSVSIPFNTIWGTPADLGPAHIYVFYYGSLDNEPFLWYGGELVKVIQYSNGFSNFSFTSNELKEELQKRVDKYKYSFQLKIILEGGIQPDSKDDYFGILTSTVIIHIKYEVP